MKSKHKVSLFNAYTALFGIYSALFLWMSYTKAICDASSFIIWPWLVTGIPWIWTVKEWVNELMSVPDSDGSLCVPLSAMAMLVVATGINVVLISWFLIRLKNK